MMTISLGYSSASFRQRTKQLPEEHTTTQEIAIVAITRPGLLTARRLQSALHNSRLYIPAKLSAEANSPNIVASQDTLLSETFAEPLSDKLGRLFQTHRALVLFMALGAAFRLLAPYVKDKRADPAVVVVDDSGQFAISALSGHRGGANDLARQVAEALSGQAVITTASDVLGTFKLDMLGREWGWQIEDESNLTSASSAVVNGQPTAIYQDAGETGWRKSIRARGGGPPSWPDNIHVVSSLEEILSGDFTAGIVISDRILPADMAGLADRSVAYRPKSLVLGIGCKRGTPVDEIEGLARRVLQEAGLSHHCIRALASLDIKRDEAGLLQFAEKLGVPVDFYSRAQLDAVKGASGVCEPAALLCAANASPTRESTLLVNKQKTNRVTVAVARVVFREQEAVRGKLYVVGLGPGDIPHLTSRARQAIQESQTIVGYTAYLKLIPSLTIGKEIVASGMKEELARAAQAMDVARSGRTVSLVSSGDAGIYGMAGLVWELMNQRGWAPGKDIDLEIVPGVTALSAAASLLGAPLAHDFAVISLSDLLIPWDAIACRLESAARADLVVVLYNPRSQQRTRQLADAQRLLLQHRSGATPVGVVTNAYRDGQRIAMTDLAHLLDCDVGMLTTIIVGNSRTFVYRDKMVTPRGYPITVKS